MAPGYWTRSLRTMSAGCGQAPGPSTAKPDVKMAREKPAIGGNLLREPKLGGASLLRRRTNGQFDRVNGQTGRMSRQIGRTG
jgi:hypothetical protein